MAHNRLAYAQYRTIEDLIRKIWTARGYETGHSDTTVAEEATRRLNELVTVRNVQFVRESIGLYEQTKSLQAKLLDQKALERLEDALATKKACVAVFNKRLTVYTLESYQSLVNGMNERKPWLKVKHTKRVPAKA